MDMEYEVIFSDRKTLGLTVDRDRSLVVRAPSGTPPERIKEFVQAKKRWIIEKQSHPQKYCPPRPVKELVSGESVLYLGRTYRLDVRDHDNEQVTFDGKFLVCGPRDADLKKLCRNWFIERAKLTIAPRVEFYAEHMGARYNTIMISDMKYRWGSCTPKKNLNFNWRLIKAPMHVLDYVIVHELAHLLEHNHSSRFWQHVRAQVPKFRESKDWLKRHGETLEDEF
jgi:predicted metal-dependent hydrolase